MFIEALLGGPIYSFIHPPVANITVSQMMQPIIRNGEYGARYLIINNGDIPLTGVSAYYSFNCFMNETKLASLNRDYLNKGGDLLYLDVPFQGPLDYNCSLLKLSLEFYEDSEGNVYQKCETITQDVCGCCWVNISVNAAELNESKFFRFCYPFTNISFITKVYAEGCITEDDVEQLGLKRIDNKTIRLIVLGLEEPCIRGEIEPEWCIEHGVLSSL
jgi:hypothetical protein